MNVSLLHQVAKDLKTLEPFLPARSTVLTPKSRTLPTPNSPQRAALESPARFLINIWGRRTGKSLCGLMKLYRSAKAKPNGRYWWVWPTLKAGRQFGWDQFVTVLLAGHAELRHSDMLVTLPNGSTIQVVGAERERAQNLRGSAIDGAVLEECRNMLRFIWSEVVRPALMSTNGWTWFNTTPRGHDWVYRLWSFAGTKKAKARGWATLRFSTYDNERLDRQEIEDLKLDLTEREVEQEIYAKFLNDGGTVFVNVDELCTLAPTTPNGGRYVMGIDFGRQTDPTVVSIVDGETKRQVFIQSWTKTDFERQEQRILGIWEEWGRPVMVPEYNSFGGPLCERFAMEHGAHLFPDSLKGFETTHSSKAQLVRTLMLALERKTWQLLDDETLKSELISFEETKTATGLPKYAAPEGLHDDHVMATLLSVWGAESYVEPFVV